MDMIIKILLALHLAFSEGMYFQSGISGLEKSKNFCEEHEISSPMNCDLNMEEDTTILKLGNTLWGNTLKTDGMRTSVDELSRNLSSQELSYKFPELHDDPLRLNLGFSHISEGVRTPATGVQKDGKTIGTIQRYTGDNFIQNIQKSDEDNDKTLPYIVDPPDRIVAVVPIPDKSVPNFQSQESSSGFNTNIEKSPKRVKHFHTSCNSQQVSGSPSRLGYKGNDVSLDLDLKLGQKITNNDSEQDLTVQYSNYDGASGKRIPHDLQSSKSVIIPSNHGSPGSLLNKMDILQHNTSSKETRQGEYQHYERAEETEPFFIGCASRRGNSKVRISRNRSEPYENSEPYYPYTHKAREAEDKEIENAAQESTGNYSKFVSMSGEIVPRVKPGQESGTKTFSKNRNIRKHRQDNDELNPKEIFTLSSINPDCLIPSSETTHPDGSHTLQSIPFPTGSIKPDRAEKYGPDDNIDVYSLEEEEDIESYYLDFLNAQHYSHALSFAKVHIDLKMRRYSKFPKTNTSVKTSNENIKSSSFLYERQGKIDEFIHKIFNQMRPPVMVEKKPHLSQSLRFLSSVGYVKINLIYDHADEIDSWFCNLRDKMSKKLKGIKVDEKTLKELTQMLHFTLAKAHGELLMGAMGVLIMMDHDQNNRLNNDQILYDFWQFLKPYLKQWETISPSQMISFQNERRTVAYGDSLMEVPSFSFLYFANQGLHNPVCSRCIWYMLQRFFDHAGIRYASLKEGYAYDQFRTRLLVLKDNMRMWQLSGVSQGRISLYLLESQLNRKGNHTGYLGRKSQQQKTRVKYV